MSNQNQAPNDENQTHPEGTVEGDPSIGEAGVDKVLLRVEGQNENIKSRPKDVEKEIAETAGDLE